MDRKCAFVLVWWLRHVQWSSLPIQAQARGKRLPELQKACGLMGPLVIIEERRALGVKINRGPTRLAPSGERRYDKSQRYDKFPAIFFFFKQKTAYEI